AFTFHYYSSSTLPVPPSFPTRRSSDLHFRDRAGRHPVRRLCPPDPREQLVQLLQGRRERHPYRLQQARRAQCRGADHARRADRRSEEHTSELQSPDHLVCRLLLEKKKT